MRITNKEVATLTGIDCIIAEIKQRRWRWLGHVMRMDNNETPSDSFNQDSAGEKNILKKKNFLNVLTKLSFLSTSMCSALGACGMPPSIPSLWGEDMSDAGGVEGTTWRGCIDSARLLSSSSCTCFSFSSSFKALATMDWNMSSEI